MPGLLLLLAEHSRKKLLLQGSNRIDKVNFEAVLEVNYLLRFIQW